MCGCKTGFARGVVLWAKAGRVIGGGGSDDFVSAAGGSGGGSGEDGGATGISGGAGVSAGTGGSGIAGGTGCGWVNSNATVCSPGNLGATGNRTIGSNAAQTTMCSSIAAPAEAADRRFLGMASGQRIDLAAVTPVSIAGTACVGFRNGML
jgi:hypothetical protein